MELLIQSQTSTVRPLKFKGGEVILSHTLQDMRLHTYPSRNWYLSILVKGAPDLNVLSDTITD